MAPAPIDHTAIGELNTIAQRTFRLSHIGAVGDVINMATRLTSVAGPGELVASNGVRSVLPDAYHREFEPMDPLDAKNVGRIKCWRWPAGSGGEW